jgi:hypothetical protein
MKRNFLLGKGERLVEDVIIRSGGGPKEAPYTFFEARSRLAPKLSIAAATVDALPAAACPNDQAVIALTLNPEYISKSAFPLELLKAAGVVPIGSRPRRVKAEKRSRNREPVEQLTTELFVMASRSTIRSWSEALPDLLESAQGARDLPSLEDIIAPSANDKIKGSLPDGQNGVFEVVLHADKLDGEQFILPYFKQYLLNFRSGSTQADCAF